MNEPSSRRSFLERLGTVVASVFAALGSYPAIRFLLDPVLTSDSESSRLSPLGKTADFVIGKPTRVNIVGDKTDGWLTTSGSVLGSVWVVRDTDNVTVLSTICPHLGCQISADKKSSGFNCPCHKSYFAKDGSIIFDANGESPSPRGMDSLEAVEKDGTLFCRYQRFVPGTPEKTIKGQS